METWKAIKGYEGLYEISDLGRVKSLPKRHKNRFGYVTTKERIMKQTPTRKGYLRVSFGSGKKKKSFLVHRLVGIAFIENTENKEQINHINGIKNDNRIDNLEWCTNTENTRHSFKHLGRKSPFKGKFGKNHNRSISVLCLNTNTRYGSMREAMRETGISDSSIGKCCKGEVLSVKGLRWSF